MKGERRIIECVSRLLLIVLALTVDVGTAAADASTYAYDAPTDTVGSAASESLDGVRQARLAKAVSVSATEVRGTSTTPSVTLVATNSSTVYRVQGGTPPAASWERISIAPGGTMMLHVTFDDLGRVQAYVATNRPGANIIAFDVDPAFVQSVRASAVPQAQGQAFPHLPQIADPTKTTNSFGLPSNWIDRLQNAAIPGSGRFVEPS